MKKNFSDTPILNETKSACHAHLKPARGEIAAIAAFNNLYDILLHQKFIKLMKLGSIEFFDKLNQLLYTFFILKEKFKMDHCHRIAGYW